MTYIYLYTRSELSFQAFSKLKLSFVTIVLAIFWVDLQKSFIIMLDLLCCMSLNIMVSFTIVALVSSVTGGTVRLSKRWACSVWPLWTMHTRMLAPANV